MKITKFVHSCLLVEMPEPVNRTALFDPGEMSAASINVDSLEFLDDIFITHEHGDHISVDLIKKLVEKFPDVRITAPQPVVDMLTEAGLTASTEVPEGVTLFDSPHEKIRPFFDVEPPAEYGYHYLDMLSDPGDSHSFNETKAILALPVTGPWGSVVNASELAIKLKPQHIIPIHDWHWSDQARESSYNNLEQVFAAHGITFHKMKTGEPVVINL
jgi:L-ascorbate metabolism protein UlaG (beta-lactamase superfamily)